VETRALFGPFRILGYVVIAAMAGALLYGLYIALANWASIAV
jgi:hypothetical protein